MIWLLAAPAVVICVYLLAVKCGPPAPSWLGNWMYAHRGLHDQDAPENTLPAFERAAANGFAIELDVHLSRDGQVVVFHDDDLSRLAGRAGRPEDLSMEELKGLSILGSRFGAPSLLETLDLVAGRVPLLVEIKDTAFSGPRRLEEETWKLLRGYEGLYAVQSFSPLSMRWFRKNAPGVPRGQLSFSFHDTRSSVPRVFLGCVRHLLTNFICRPNFISYGKEDVKTFIVRRLRRGGVPVLAWTVESRREAEEVSPFCDSIIFQRFRPDKHTLS